MGPQLKQLTPEEIQARVTEKGITVDEAKTELENEVRTTLEDRALEEGKTVEELIAEDEELSGIIEKFGGDPIKIAKALKISQQGVSKVAEREKALQRENEDLESRLTEINVRPHDKRDPKEQITEALKKKYPTLDEDVIAAMVEQQMEMANALRWEYQIDKAQDRIEIEKDTLKNDSYYKKYQEEIDKLIDQQPIQMKMQKRIVKRCRDLIVGQHMDEIVKESRGSASSDTDIVGQIRGSKPPVTSVGGGRGGGLTPRQAQQAAEMGVKPETFLAILKKHKEQAKKNGLSEPELLTDTWKKR